MMKKIYALLFGVVMMLLCIKVNASASLNITCDKSILNEGGSTACSVKLNTNESSISAVNFDINTDFLTMTESSSPGCDSIYGEDGGGYQCNKSYSNGDTILTMTLVAPKKFYNTSYVLKTTGVTILNGSNKVQTASSYSTNLSIKGSLSSSGKSAKLNIECDDTTNIGSTVTCQLVLNLTACYYTSISFDYDKNIIDSFTYDEDAFSSAGIFSSGNKVLVSLGNRMPPFVGRTVVGEIKFTMTSTTKSFALRNIVLSTNEVGYANGTMTNISHDTKRLDDIYFDYNISMKSSKLGDLRVDGATVYNFSSDQTVYNLSISARDIGSDKIKISGVAEDSTATVSGNGTFQLKEGQNVFKVICTNSKVTNGNTKTEYTINITFTDDRSDDNKLKSLSLSDDSKNSININFDPNVTNYSAEVEGSVTSVSISSTLNDLLASYVSGFGNRVVSLAYGSNTILLKVKSEKGNIREYKIVINRKDNRNTDNTLKSLIVNDEVIDLKSNTTKYTIDVNQDVKTAKITSELSNSKASYVKNYGNRTVDLKYGKNTILLKVKAENESIKEYNITVNRKDGRSTNNTLKSLDIDGYINDFKPEVKEYSFEVENSVSKVTIKSELSDLKASYVKNYGNRVVSLNEGNNEILIKVKAENESINEYKIKIFRAYSPEKLKNNTSIKQLSIGNLVINNSEDGIYTYNLNEKVDKLNINVLLTNPNAIYEIVGNNNIDDGSEIKIIVTSEDKKEKKEYLIKVNVVNKDENVKQETNLETKVEEKNSKPNILIIVGAVFVVFLVIGVIAGNKSTKSSTAISQTADTETTLQSSNQQVNTNINQNDKIE